VKHIQIEKNKKLLSGLAISLY